MKTVSFVRWKFNRMLAVATVIMSVNYIVMLSGSVIVGNLVGADGLAGVSACMPVFGFASFLASLLSVGTSLVFSRAMGTFDAHRAAGVFSQSIMFALGLGAIIYSFMQFGESFFLDVTGVTDVVRAQAEHYWNWQSVALALLPAVLTLEALVYADGDGAVATLASGLHVSGSIGLSIWFTRQMGDAGGVAAGTALTMVIVLCACCLHFLRLNNHLKFRFFFSWKELKETLLASLADSTIYLCWGALVFVVNKFVLAEYGQYLLSVVALAVSLVQFSIIFDGVGEALIPLGGMYDGEGNKPALRVLANHSAVIATLEGLICGGVIFIFAPTLATFYGFDPTSFKLFESAIDAIRILAFAMPFMGLMMMMNTHYLVVHHIRFAVSVTVMKDFICPCLGVLLLGRLGGHWGQWIWVGFTVGYVVAAVYPFLFVFVRYGWHLFPWLIEHDDGRSINFAIQLTDDSLSDAKGHIGEFLNGHNIFETREILDAIERAGREILAANVPRVRCEYFVSVEKGLVRMILRDNGKAVVSNHGKYLNTLGCNRTEHRFDIISSQKG